MRGGLYSCLITRASYVLLARRFAGDSRPVVDASLEAVGKGLSVNNFGKNLALWIVIGLLLVALFNLFQTSSNRGPQSTLAVFRLRRPTSTAAR